MVTKSNKISQVLKILLIFSLLLISLSSVFAFEELLYSPFTQAGGWVNSATQGRNIAFDYDNTLYVVNGANIYSYDMSTWEYLGYQTFSSTITDLHVIGSVLYLTQSPYVKSYNLDASLAELDSWIGTNVSTVTSFDVNSDNVVITGTGGIEVIDKSSKLQETYIVTGAESVVRFSTSGETIISGAYDDYQYSPNFWATSSGGLISSGAYNEGDRLRGMYVSDTGDYLTIHRYDSPNYYLDVYNFTESGIDTKLFGASGSAYKYATGRLSVDNTLIAHFYGGSTSNPVYLKYLNGTDIGSFVPDNSYEEGSWAYIPSGDRYFVVGSEAKLYVYITGIAGPLLSTNLAEIYDDTKVNFSGSISDMGVADQANCSIEYRKSGDESWTKISSYNSYTNASSFPDTFYRTASGFEIGGLYDYRAFCIYSSNGEIKENYGRTRNITVPPFDIFKAILENFAIVIYLSFMAFVIIGLASNGINNILILIVVAVVLGFLGYMLNILNIAIAIFILVAGLLIGMIYLMMGERE